MLELYTAGTHNGIRANIALAESGLGYHVHKLNLSAGDQRQPAFIGINPAGRIPALKAWFVSAIDSPWRIETRPAARSEIDTSPISSSSVIAFFAVVSIVVGSGYAFELAQHAEYLAVGTWRLAQCL